MHGHMWLLVAIIVLLSYHKKQVGWGLLIVFLLIAASR